MPFVRLERTKPAGLALKSAESRDCRVDAGDRFLAPQRRQRLENSGGNGAAGDRNPDRLVELARLDVEALGQRPQRRLQRSGVEAVRLAESVARGLEQRTRPRPSSPCPRPWDRRRAARRGSGSAARPRPASALSPGRSRRRHAGDRRAPGPGGGRRRPCTPPSGISRMKRPLTQRSFFSSKIAADLPTSATSKRSPAPRWTSASCRLSSPSRAGRGSCAPRPAGSRRRAAPAPRRRRGAWRASCRRARAAAAGARSAAAHGRGRAGPAAAWGCWRGDRRRARPR